MPRRLIRTDLDGLEKNLLTKNNIRSDLSLSDNQHHYVNVTSSLDLQTCNDNKANLNINGGKQPVHIFYGKQPFEQWSVSRGNEQIRSKKRKALTIRKEVSNE